MLFRIIQAKNLSNNRGKKIHNKKIRKFWDLFRRNPGPKKKRKRNHDISERENIRGRMAK